MPHPQLLSSVRSIAREAGDAILEHYGSSVPVEYKGDDSPLTHADRASHHLIKEKLEALTPDIRVLSEESEENVAEERHGWGEFWLVDPLDGTKEFIKQSGEFTVNIALIDGDSPTLGVIYVPAQNLTFYAVRNEGAFRQEGGEDPQPIRTRPADEDNLAIVASRDHAGPELETFLSNLSDPDLESMGSSLKFCLVAAGRADVYFRDVPTMEWDTGAAQCIVETAGGMVCDFEGNRLTYNKESLRNPPLITVGDPSWDWQAFMP